EELADDHGPERHGKGQDQFDRARAAFFRPKPHADRGHQEQIEPGMEREEASQIRLALFIEAADIEGEALGQSQKDHQNHISERRREIAFEFARENRGKPSHSGSPLSSVHAADFTPASGRVSARKTSSRRPLSTPKVWPWARSASGVPSMTIRPRSMISARVQ